MKISENEVKLVLEKVFDIEGDVDFSLMTPETVKRIKEYFKHCELEEEDFDVVNEDTYTVDPDDSNMQQKVQKIKNDTSLFDPNKDQIKLAGAGDESVTESTYKKSEVLNLMAETKKKKGNIDDYLNAIKKADRDLGYELDGPGWNAKDKAHKNKKQYDRKQDKKDSLNDSVNEEILSKNDVVNMILEKKYNGKAYTKSELLKAING